MHGRTCRRVSSETQPKCPPYYYKAAYVWSILSNLIDRITLHIRLVVGCHAHHLWKSPVLDDEREQNHILVAHPGSYHSFYFGIKGSHFYSFYLEKIGIDNLIFPLAGQFDFLSAHCLGAPVKVKIVRFCRDTQVQVQVSFYHSRQKVLSHSIAWVLTLTDTALAIRHYFIFTYNKSKSECTHT